MSTIWNRRRVYKLKVMSLTAKIAGRRLDECDDGHRVRYVCKIGGETSPQDASYTQEDRTLIKWSPFQCRHIDG